MRLGIVATPNGTTLALEHGGNAYDVRTAAREMGPQAAAVAGCATIEALLTLGQGALDWINKNKAQIATPKNKIANPKWRAPIQNPGKVPAIGLNYEDHCREQGLEPPKSPVMFGKFPSAIIGPGEEIVWEPALTEQVDWEVELAVVIGKKARHVKAKDAFEYVAGYMVANDVTARNLQKSDGQFTRAKSIDTFCPIGPYFVTKDEVPDPHNLNVKLWVNGVLKQDSNTKNLIFKIPELVEWLSRAFTLNPGDFFLTGTPPGVGMHRKPPEFLKNGDKVEVEIQGLGRLENRCRTETAKPTPTAPIPARA